MSTDSDPSMNPPPTAPEPFSSDSSLSPAITMLSDSDPSPTPPQTPELSSPLDSDPFPESQDPERVELITIIQERLGVPVDQSTWALLWLCDKGYLREKAIHSTDYCGGELVVLKRGSPGSFLAMTWATKTRSKNDDQSAPPSKKPRDKTVREIARERDRKLCLMTSSGEPLEIAHIYPYSLGTRENMVAQIEFWKTLHLFWTVDQVTAWKNIVLGKDGTEQVCNLMTLRSDVHKLWGMARFALKPERLNPDGKELTVRFYWLPALEWTVDRQLFPPPDNMGLKEVSAGGSVLIDCVSRRVVCSGEKLTFTTTDPINCPLPSWDLLEMQWHLCRLQALSGAADVDESLIWPDHFGPPTAGFLSTRGDDDDDDDDDDNDDDDSPPPPRGRAPGLENIPFRPLPQPQPGSDKGSRSSSRQPVPHYHQYTR